MIDGLKPPSARPIPCKICSGDTVLYGVVDFHKSCAEEQGVRLPLSGIPIYYRRCATCKFLFTDAFDTWSTEQFLAHVYNADYLAVDPHYQVLRPRENGASVARLWGPYRAETRVLDYGGGSDVLCSVLRAAGFPVAVTYDPMIPDYARRPDGKFELITCFETLEHLPDPAAGVAAIVESAADPGLIFFSTFIQPEGFEQVGLNWWYVGPRNGHISIFSRPALELLWKRHGYRLVSLNDNFHLAFRTLPAFLAHLDKRPDAGS